MVAVILAAHGRITTYHDQQIPGKPRKHWGIDQGHNQLSAYDLQIMAPADGLVTFAGPFGSYGNVLYITHDDGWVSVLAHHEKQFVSKGQRVRQGQIVARMGNTGTKYIHSHQELRNPAAKQMDPLLHLGTSSSTSGNTPIPVEEDDMTPDQWLKIDAMANSVADISFALTNHIKPQTDQINGLAVNVGVIRWAVADDAAGLRQMVGNLTKLVAALDAGGLDEATLAAELAKALAPVTDAPTVAEIAAAVQDEQDKRERERLAQ